MSSPREVRRAFKYIYLEDIYMCTLLGRWVQVLFTIFVTRSLRVSIYLSLRDLRGVVRIRHHKHQGGIGSGKRPRSLRPPNRSGWGSRGPRASAGRGIGSAPARSQCTYSLAVPPPPPGEGVRTSCVDQAAALCCILIYAHMAGKGQFALFSGG